MSLPPGSKVGIYEVIELIGVGGMGEVYRARDSRLNRDVALKVLPEIFARDAERMARFEREAQVLASLNHPNIAALYGLEESHGVRALVMELVEGPTLAQRLESGPLAMEDALPIAKQIAEALEYAHERGIVHRDLKPANVKLTRDGAAKVLDFGLAKAIYRCGRQFAERRLVANQYLTGQPDACGSDPRHGCLHGPGTSARAHADHRADIWAFGHVLYEMLTGRRAFEGDDVADVMARVIQSEPDWTLLPAATPQALRTLLRRCLKKDAHQRLHSIADARIELEDIASGTTATEPRPATAVTRGPWVPALAGLVVGALVGVVGVGWNSGTPPAPRAAVIRFSLSAPDGWVLARAPGTNRLVFELSPDGEKIAAVLSGPNASRRVFVRRLDETSFRELPVTDLAGSVFWAPNSERLGFSTPNGVRQTNLDGGGARLMTTAPSTFANMAWGPSDIVVAAGGVRSPLLGWPASGGQPARLGELPDGVVQRFLPRLLPDGKRVVFADGHGDGRITLRAQDLSGQNTMDVASFQTFGQGSSTFDYQSGHLLMCLTEASGRTILTAQPADPATLQVSG